MRHSQERQNAQGITGGPAVQKRRSSRGDNPQTDNPQHSHHIQQESHQRKGDVSHSPAGQMGEVKNIKHDEHNQTDSMTVARDVPSNADSGESQKQDQVQLEANKMNVHFQQQQRMADTVLDNKENALEQVEKKLDQKSQLLSDRQTAGLEEQKGKTEELHRQEAKTVEMAQKLEEQQEALRRDEKRRAEEVAKLTEEARHMANNLASQATQERKHVELTMDKLELDENVAKKKAQELANARQQEIKTVTVKSQQIHTEIETLQKRIENLAIEHGRKRDELERKKHEFEDTRKNAEAAAKLAKNLSDERHEIELRLQELIKNEEEAKKQEGFLSDRQAKERNMIQTQSGELGTLESDLEKLRSELVHLDKEKQEISVKIEQHGVNEEEARKKAEDFGRAQAAKRRELSERLEQLRRDEQEAIRHSNELADAQAPKIADESSAKLDIYEHTHMDAENGTTTDSARVTSGNRKVVVEHDVRSGAKNNGKGDGLIGSVLKSIF